MAEALSLTSPSVRLNAICPYFTMFPITFPLSQLAGAAPGDPVLDPFCGRGTTLFAARLLGLPAAGVDANPVAAAIAAAKLAVSCPQAVLNEAAGLLTQFDPGEIPTGPFWELAYHPETLTHLCQLRTALLAGPNTPARVLLRAIILGILHGPRHKGPPSYLSNQMPRTYATKPDPAVRFWRRRGLTPVYVDLLHLLSRRARFSLKTLPPAGPGEVVQGDSRVPGTVPPAAGGYNWVVTSPPYWGMRTYLSDQWLRLWFLGGESTVRYRREGQVRHQLSAYVNDLAAVWRNVATACRPGARLIIRFGAIPTCPVEPRDLLLQTLTKSGARWRVTDVADAGTPPRWRRQADQFEKPRAAIAEIDLTAVLEG